MMRAIRRILGLDCKCKEFRENWVKLHRSCEHAALNGMPISMDAIKYCPWCGCRAKEVQYYD